MRVKKEGLKNKPDYKYAASNHTSEIIKTIKFNSFPTKWSKSIIQHSKYGNPKWMPILN